MNDGKTNVPTIKSKFIYKLLAAFIFIIYVIHIAVEYALEKTCAACVQPVSLETLNQVLPLEQIFHNRKEILERSCSFIEQLKTVNRIANVNELKEIHLLLHDLMTSHDKIAKRLQSYDKTEISLNRTQENFMMNFIRCCLVLIENIY